LVLEQPGPPSVHYTGEYQWSEQTHEKKRGFLTRFAPFQGTLASLAIFVATENFKSNTPFADMLPERSDYWEHPIVSLHTVYDVWRLTQLHNSAIVAEKRKKNVDDVVKRAEFRRAHGLEKEGGFGDWTAKEDPQSPQSPQAEPGKRAKWLGIF
jgi:hypothetical protein